MGAYINMCTFNDYMKIMLFWSQRGLHMSTLKEALSYSGQSRCTSEVDEF